MPVKYAPAQDLELVQQGIVSNLIVLQSLQIGRGK